jgi:uncharacterized membrane protein (DUF2068 family)
MHHPVRRPELLVCALRGHALAGAAIEPLDERHAAVVRATADGRRLVHCLRCGDWVVTDPPAPGAGVAVASVDELERPRQGKALRQAIVVRLIAIDRIVHTFVFTVVAVAAFVLDRNITTLHDWAANVRDALASAHTGTGGASSHGLLSALLERVSHLSVHSLRVIAVFAIIYATVSAIEAVGLWRERRWAEYLTALSTTLFLPIELRELAERVTLVRISALIINLAILVYLVWAKHLFGIGGRLPTPEVAPLEPLPELVPAAPR